MIILKEKDFLEVKQASLIADYDKETILNLYQPIIGYKACVVYFSLWNEAVNQKLLSMINHEQFLNRLKMNVSEFVDSRKLLEGIGLVKTFLKKSKDLNIYHYEIYAPKSPKDFFSNALFYGLLIKAIGDYEANRIKNLYSVEPNEDYGDDISTSFVNAFNPDFDDPVFLKVINSNNNLMNRKSGKVVSEFSYEKFFARLQEISQINSNLLTKKEMKEIERLATLNNVSEEIAADRVSEIYDSSLEKGKRIDFKALSKVFIDENSYNFINSVSKAKKQSTLSSNNVLGRKINLMESVSPKDFLSILQNGSKPATADLKIINDLSMQFHLSNSVINALVDYVLTINNNILSRPLTEKIAASLSREGVETAIDAMNYLKKVNRKPKLEDEQSYNQPAEENEESSDISWDELLKEIENK